MWLQIALPVAVFTGVVLSLTLLVLAARRGLEPGGLVSLALNGGRRLDIQAGEQLLASLAANEIYLPAACGGRRRSSLPPNSLPSRSPEPAPHRPSVSVGPVS
mgnify:CR=1 FL=1